MILRSEHLTRADLEMIARDLDIELYNVREQGRGIAFVLRPTSPDRFRARSSRRRIWAVCWHGHYAFMEQVFERDPNAVLASTLARYEGRDDFHAKAGATSRRPFSTTCKCLQDRDPDTYRLPVLRQSIPNRASAPITDLRDALTRRTNA